MSKIFRHHDYELECGAKMSDSGKFRPTLTVSKQCWPTRPRIIDVTPGDHVTVETAIEAARESGIEWVRNYG